MIHASPQRHLLYGIISVLLFSAPLFVGAQSASLGLGPAGGNYEEGKEFSIQVISDSGTTKVNAAQAKLSFDTNVLRVKEVTKKDSVFTLFTLEPTFSNSAGTIEFGGGNPPGFSGRKNLVTIVFVGKSRARTVVDFESGSILAADGKGTDIMNLAEGSTYTITEATEAVQVPSKPDPTPSFQGQPPGLPEVRSETHPNPETWYATSTVIFSWDVPFDVTSVAVAIAPNKGVDPDEVFTPAIGIHEIVGVEDGEWYFHVQFKNASGWGEVGSVPIKVDTEPPQGFDIGVVDETEYEFAALTFETIDTLSGLKEYEVRVGDLPPDKIKPDELIDGHYKLMPQEGGLQVVNIKAVDNAGNVREVENELDIPFVERPGSKVIEEEEEEPWITLQTILTIFFAFTTGVFAGLNFYNKHQFSKEKNVILDEAIEVREKKDKIFTALRKEIEEQVQQLDVNPQLSPNERYLVERMKEALDLSDELIDSEIEDVRKLVRK